MPASGVLSQLDALGRGKELGSLGALPIPSLMLCKMLASGVLSQLDAVGRGKELGSLGALPIPSPM
eukprot:scaffold12797_cov17-Tisochrysis_lutea.AAC.1